ncbi:hypothetical protein KAR10_10405, partial [bacterium]|nr:hypothetical protein [bacterium]
ITIISLIVERLLWLLFTIFVAEEMSFKFSFVSRRAFFALFGFGGLILVNNVANIVGYEAVKWVIGMELSVMDVGAYSLIAILAAMAATLSRSISSVLMPVASKYNALQQHDTNVLLALLATKYAVIISSSLCLMPLLLIEPMLSLWVGEKYPSEYISALAQSGMLLLFGQWFVTTIVCMLQMLHGVGKVWVPAIIAMSWALGGLGGVWVYLHWGQSSLFGAVTVITIARVIGAVLHMVYGLNILKIPTRRMLLGSIMRPGSAAVIACAMSYLLVQSFDVYELPSFVAAVIVLVAGYALLVWFMVLSGDERVIITDNIRSIFARKSRAVSS